MHIMKDRIMRTSNSEKTNLSDKLVGVSGWLLFFCVSLTILGPLEILYPLLRALISGGTSLLSTNIPNNIFTPSAIFKFVTYGVTIYGIVVGIRLWLTKPHALREAKIFLIIVLGRNILYFAFSIASGVGLRQVLVVAIREIFSFVVWWIYLRKSIRVKNTYQTAKAPKKKEKQGNSSELIRK